MYFFLQNSLCFMALAFFLSCLYSCSLSLVQHLSFFSTVIWQLSSFTFWSISFSLFLIPVYFLVFTFLIFFFCSRLTVSQCFSNVSPLPVPPTALLGVERVPVSSFFQNSLIFFLGREISFALICGFSSVHLSYFSIHCLGILRMVEGKF